VTARKPGAKRGRPTKAQAEARKLASGPGDWVETHRGVNQSWLANAFRMDTRTVKTRLAHCPVLRKGGDHPIYDFAEAARYLAKPPPSAVAAFFRGMKVTDLPTFLQDQYWSAQRKRQIYEENAGNLWRTEAVLEVLGEAFNGLKSEIQLWIDNVDQRVSLTPDQRAALTVQVDSLQEGLHARLVEMPRKSSNYSQLESGETITETSPEYVEVFEPTEEELLG
jgi:hypothetical protein